MFRRLNKVRFGGVGCGVCTSGDLALVQYRNFEEADTQSYALATAPNFFAASSLQSATGTER
jgi:hypothetical protein